VVTMLAGYNSSQKGSRVHPMVTLRTKEDASQREIPSNCG
jgi:hypothetical protein